MILVETDVSGEWDSSTDWPALADESVRAAVAASRHSAMLASGITFELSAKFTSDQEVRSLNAGYRGRDKPTNVLSFPMVESDLLQSIIAADRGEVLLGDIVLAHGVCAAEAAEKAIAMRNHAAHLLVHGTLHLLGYDHEESEGQAEAMEEVERRALAGLGIADPYMEVQA
jgi:probable rRNA maturation factor